MTTILNISLSLSGTSSPPLRLTDLLSCSASLPSLTQVKNLGPEIQVLECRIITVFLPLPTHTSSSSSPIDKFPPLSWDMWDLEDNDNDNDGWQDMPIVLTDELTGGLDDENQRIYHYWVNEEAGSSKLGSEGGVGGGGNATGTMTLDTAKSGY
ncbi:hypothetical protein C8J55DRAFT_610187 [Lentinula edodes]|uniref:Uncharacterized protein n=1 Tax=Lentinula lateritia TaxID=40482 RepID=A0A9W8ZQ77_9AGAR|nr:hypothetical protein C8J55DRAFT_610187 [Lentinula edodes]